MLCLLLFIILFINVILLTQGSAGRLVIIQMFILKIHINDADKKSKSIDF